MLALGAFPLLFFWAEFLLQMRGMVGMMGIQPGTSCAPVATFSHTEPQRHEATESYVALSQLATIS
jgi:hypothetical protein